MTAREILKKYEAIEMNFVGANLQGANKEMNMSKLTQDEKDELDRLSERPLHEIQEAARSIRASTALGRAVRRMCLREETKMEAHLARMQRGTK